MAERDTGFLAPFDIKSKAEKFAEDLRVAEDTNYDQTDNKYDAIRHIGASLALYAQYPDLASDAILNVKEYVFGAGDPKGQKMDLHNNAIGKKLYEMLDEEQADNLTTEQALEIAKSYVEEWDLAEQEGREIDLPEEMKPLMYYGVTKQPETKKEEDGGLYEIGPEGTWVEKTKMNKGGIMAAEGVDVSTYGLPKEDPFLELLPDTLDEPKKYDRYIPDAPADFDPETILQEIFPDDIVDEYPIEKDTSESQYTTEEINAMDKELDQAFTDFEKSKGSAADRDVYRKRVQKIYTSNPDLFTAEFQDKNTDQLIEMYNELDFADEEVPFDEQIAETAKYRSTVPFGSENDDTLGGDSIFGLSVGARGRIHGKSRRYDDDVEEIFAPGGADKDFRDNILRHEGLHALTDHESVRELLEVYPNELLVRAYDVLRGVASGDEEWTKRALKFIEKAYRGKYGKKDIKLILSKLMPLLKEKAAEMNAGGLMAERQALESQLESGEITSDEYDAQADQLSLRESFELPEGDVRSDIFPIISRQDDTAEGGKFLDIGTPGFVKDAILRVGDIVADLRSGKAPKPETVAETAMDVAGTGFGASALTGVGSDIAGIALGSNVITGKFGKKSPQTSFGIGDTVAPPVDRRSAKKVKDTEGKVADFHGGMGAKVDDIYVGDDGKTKVVVRYMKDTDEIDPETNTPIFEEVTQTFDADQAEKAGLETLVKGKQPEIIPAKLAEAEDMNTLNKILTAEYGDPDEYSQVLKAIAGSLYDAGKLGNVKLGKRFKNANGDIVEVTGVDATLAPYPTKELAGKSDRTYFEVGVDKPVGIQIQYKNLTRGTEGSDIFDNFKGGKYEEVTGELKQVKQPKTGLMADELQAVEPMEVGFNEALMSGKFLKNYDNTVAQEMIKNSTTAKTGARGETDLLMTEVPEGTKVGVRLNLNSKIEGMPKGLDKLQTLHKGSYSGKALSYQPFVVVKDVKFNVSQAGRTGIAARIKEIDTPEAKNKFPAMSVDGKYVPNANLLEGNTDDLVEIGFNPGEHHLFIDLTTGQAVKGADEAMVIGDRIYARNVEYWKKSQAPKPIPTKSGVDIPSSVRFKEMNAGGLMLDDYNRAES